MRRGNTFEVTRGRTNTTHDDIRTYSFEDDVLVFVEYFHLVVFMNDIKFFCFHIFAFYFYNINE